MMSTPAATRLGESAVEALLIVLLVLVPAGRSVPDGQLAAAAMITFTVLAAAAYGFHALTFDTFRVVTQRARRPEQTTITGGQVTVK
jgi:hypothetical protein